MATDITATQTTPSKTWNIRITGTRTTGTPGTIQLTRRHNGWVIILPTVSPVLTLEDFTNITQTITNIENGDQS